MPLVRSVLAVALIVVMFAACQEESPDPGADTLQDESTQQAVTQARELSDHLMRNLKQHLMREVAEGGFAGAVQVCSEIGQQIPERIADSTGHQIRRVSLGYRNPADIPDAYERRKLEAFEQLNKTNELRKEYFEVVEEDSVEVLRYMRPLLADGLCLNCHGPQEEIPDEVRAILAKTYPEDRATGYQLGDVRGAVSVKIKLDE